MDTINLAKYENYRVSSAYVENGQFIKGACVEGQRKTDLNWEIIETCECRIEAIELVKKICKASGKHMFYNEAGYGFVIDAE